MRNIVGATSFLEVYFYTLFFSLLFKSFQMMQPRKKKLYIFLVFGYFAFLTAFRMSYIGSDTPTYLNSFRNIARISTPFDAIKREGMEPGFVIYSWLLSKINSDPQTLLIASSLIVYISTGRFVYKYVNNPGLFCCIFVGIMQFDFFMSAMRQSLSIAIILFFFDFIVQRKFLKFAIVCLIASTFHYSSLLLLLFCPFLSKSEESSADNALGKLCGFLCIIVIGLFFDKLINMVMYIFPKYTYYLGSKTFDGVPRIALILRICVYVLLFMVPQLLGKEKSPKTQLDTLTGKLSYMNICTLFVAMNAVALSRFSNTFSMFAIMYFVNQAVLLKRDDYKLLTVITLFLFALYGLVIVIFKTPEWTKTFPIRLIF